MTKSLKDSEIRPPGLIEKKAKLYLQDLNLFKKNKLLPIDCPACSSNNQAKLFTKMGFNYVSCKECFTVFLNPRPSEEALENFYKSSKSMMFWDKIFRETELVRKEKIFEPRLELVSTLLSKYKIRHCNELVEVGAGYGWFCELAKKKKLAKKIIAIEPSPSFSKACRKISGIKVIESTIEKCTQLINADMIVNFELIAHLFDPRKFLESCFFGLKDNGLLIISTPNFFGLDIQILKEKSDTMVPHTLNLFNPKSIEILLKSLGFRNISILTPGLMDIHVILNKIKSNEIHAKDYPFFDLLLKNNNDEFIDDLQSLLQKHKMSSHMVISAQK